MSRAVLITMGPVVEMEDAPTKDRQLMAENLVMHLLEDQAVRMVVVDTGRLLMGVTVQFWVVELLDPKEVAVKLDLVRKELVKQINGGKG